MSITWCCQLGAKLFPYTTLFRSAILLTGGPMLASKWNGQVLGACTDCRRLTEEHLAVPLADWKSTRLNSSHGYISYAVFCLKKKTFVFRSCFLTSEPSLMLCLRT